MKLPRLDLTSKLALLPAAAMGSYGGPEAQDQEDDRHDEQQGEHLDQGHKEGIPQTVVEVRRM